MTVAFFIHCQTGCTCCNSDNHYTGPYRSLDYAKEMVEQYKKGRRTASQYARQGIYDIGWSEAEVLPDGRVVCDDRIFAGFSDDEGVVNDDIPSYSFYPDHYNLKHLPEAEAANDPAKLG